MRVRVTRNVDDRRPRNIHSRWFKKLPEAGQFHAKSALWMARGAQRRFDTGLVIGSLVPHQGELTIYCGNILPKG